MSAVAQGLLVDQVAIVTGGSGGIGKSIVERFLSEGAKVVIFGRNQEKGERAVAELSPLGNVSFKSVDVGNYEQVETAVKEVVQEHGKLDILVNNAGITRDNLILRMKDEDWSDVMETNLKSCFNTCKAVTRPMMKQRKGKVILVSSVAGLQGNPGQTNYAASKAGMLGFAKSLARELSSRGICVNCIAPGFIDTAMTDKLTDKQKEDILTKIPLGRIGRPEEIGAAALYLAAESGNYITGQTITVDGGMVM